MGGAATICSAIVSAAKLNLPINIIGEGAKGGALGSLTEQTADMVSSNLKRPRNGFHQAEAVELSVVLSELIELNVFCSHGL